MMTSDGGRLYTHADLFCGVGGFTLGLAATGRFVTTFACDIDAKCRETYFTNHGLVPAADVKEIDRVDADIVTAGFPCQPFSRSGNCLGRADPRGNLCDEVVRIVGNSSPIAFLLENVPQFKKHFPPVKEAFESFGYTVYDTLINSENFGVPQSRERFYVVGIRGDPPLGSFQFPVGSPVAVPASAVMVPERDVPDEVYFPKEHADAMFARKLANSAAGLGFGVRILDPSRPFNTITNRDDGWNVNVVMASDGRTRFPVESEVKAAFGFPADFVLPAPGRGHKPYNQTKGMRMLGNSVVVPVITAIGKRLARAMDAVAV